MRSPSLLTLDALLLHLLARFTRSLAGNAASPLANYYTALLQFPRLPPPVAADKYVTRTPQGLSARRKSYSKSDGKPAQTSAPYKKNSLNLAQALAKWPEMYQGLCLLRRAFVFESQKRTLLFYGDSTMRNQFHALCFAIRGEINATTIQAASCHGKLGETQITAIYESSVVFPSDPLKVLVSVRHQWNLLSEDISVFYIGVGLWLQWPQPFLPSLGHWQTYMHWRNYEVMLNHILDELASVAPPMQIALTSTHSECDNDFYGKWKKVLAMQNHTEAVLPCITFLNNLDADGKSKVGSDVLRLAIPDSMPNDSWIPASVPPSRAMNDCLRGMRGRNASLAMNRRLGRVIAVRQHNKIAPTIKFVDAFKLDDGRCDRNLIGDGMHYVGLLFDELIRLFDALHYTVSYSADTCDLTPLEIQSDTKWLRRHL